MIFDCSIRRLEENFHLYQELVELIKRNSRFLSKEIPDFIFSDSIKYFENLERYEDCLVLKNFCINYPERIVKISFAEWFLEEEVNA